MLHHEPHRRRLLSCLALLLLIPLSGLAAPSPRPAVLEYDLAPLSEIPVLRTAPLDRAALLAEDAAKADAGGPERFAVAAEVEVDCARDGRWEQPTALTRVWRLRVQAPEALSVNLGFSVYDLPDGGLLSIYPADLDDPDDPRGVRVFDAADADILGQLWTPVVLADDLVIELAVPAGSAARLELAAVNRGYRLFGEDPAAKAGSCNIDVACPEGDPWREEIQAVGMYTIDGVWKCSGSLVNNTRRDGAPLFLTAYHCNSNMQQFANTVVVYWNYQSPVCGQHGGGVLDDFTSGAIFRATYSLSDFTLIELDEPLDPAFGLTLAGWDRRDRAPQGAVAIHHPSLDEKSISFENDPLTVTTYLETPVPGDGTHLRVTDWDQGTTEPGSSGSPLFDPDHHVVGQLHGGYAACGNDLSDWYGRLAVSWEGGGTPDSRLRDWLDPDGTGEEFVDLLNPAQAELVVTPVTDVEFRGVAGGDPAGLTAGYTLRNPGGADLTFSVTADADWVQVSPTGGVLAAEDSTVVTVSLAPGVFAEPVGSHTAVVSFVNTDSGLGNTTRQVTLVVLPLQPGVAPAAPNPFADFTVVTYTLTRSGPVRARVLDLKGRCVRDFGLIDGEVGNNELPWNGTDDRGRKVAAGTYVLRLEAPEGTFSTRMTHWR